MAVAEARDRQGQGNHAGGENRFCAQFGGRSAHAHQAPGVHEIGEGYGRRNETDRKAACLRQGVDIDAHAKHAERPAYDCSQSTREYDPPTIKQVTFPRGEQAHFMLPWMEYCKTVPSVMMPKPGPLTNTRLPTLRASLLLAIHWRHVMKLLAKRAEDRYQTAAGLERTRRDRWRRRRDSCPASRGSHTVSTPCRFLESTAAVDRRPQRIPAMYRCRASTAPGVEHLSGLRL